LYRKSIPSWFGDLAIVICCISYQTPPFDPLALTIESATTLLDNVTLSMKLHIDNAIVASSKGHLEYDNGQLIHQSLQFQCYLHVTIPTYQKSLIQLLLSDHKLAEASFRYSERNQPSVPCD
jgi:hypothetical protein